MSLSITIDHDLLEKLKLLAEKDDRSLSQYINIIVFVISVVDKCRKICYSYFEVK